MNNSAIVFQSIHSYIIQFLNTIIDASLNRSLLMVFFLDIASVFKGIAEKLRFPILLNYRELFPFTIWKLIFWFMGATMISMFWIFKWILVLSSFNACRVVLRIINPHEMPRASYLLFQPKYLEIIVKLMKITQCLNEIISCTLITFFSILGILKE